ncbi:hypothetical protein Ahy_A09g044580 [Arachis hypogaea]|uniref:Transposase MuDR plant domain-containing protein n=1 Tax=Arachis hypogaea TaxID=3818 RepID=A0A445BKK8_ARAHY|nr:hypothetical protein Ahy_A09g044580 [Arachis hypogaea]
MFDIHGRIMAEQVMDLSAEDDSPFAPPLIHVAMPVEDMEVGKEDSDEEYVVDSKDNDSSKDDDDEEFVPETPAEAAYYNLDDGVEFRVGHRFKCRDAVMQGVKNYSIRRSAEYRVVESDQLEYHVHCRQAANGCPWKHIEWYVLASTVELQDNARRRPKSYNSGSQCRWTKLFDLSVIR